VAILVTGGVGFIGTNIVQALLRKGEKVIVFDITSPELPVRRFLEEVSEEVQFVQGDIRDRTRLKEIIQTYAIQEIVHAAAITANAPEAEQQLAADVVEVNIIGTVNILEVAKSADIQRVIYLSSSGLYAAGEDIEKPVSEEFSIRVRGLYATTKQACEHICRRYKQLYGMDIVMTRIAAQYGPFERKTHARQTMSLIHDLVELAVQGTPIRVRHQKMPKDWTYAADTAEGVAAMLKAKSLNHDLYNLSVGRNYDLLDVLEALKKHIPELTYEFSETPNVSRSLILRGPLDISWARADFGFIPKFDIQKGLCDYLKWLQRYTRKY